MFIDARSKGRTSVPTGDIFLTGQNLVAASWAGHKGDFDAHGCTFERCDFRDMRVPTFTFASGKVPARYIECVFDGSRIKRTIVGEARFERCSLRNVDIGELFAHAAEFVDCVFSGKLRKGMFYARVVANYSESVRRETNEIVRNDFSAMEFEDVGFRMGVDLSQQSLPVGDKYLCVLNAERALRQLREKVLGLPVSKLREDGFQFLQEQERIALEGQRDLFLVRGRKPWPSKETEDLAWERLRKAQACSEAGRGG